MICWVNWESKKGLRTDLKGGASETDKNIVGNSEKIMRLSEFPTTFFKDRVLFFFLFYPDLNEISGKK